MLSTDGDGRALLRVERIPMTIEVVRRRHFGNEIITVYQCGRNTGRDLRPYPRGAGHMSHNRRVLLINPRMCSPTAIRLPLSLLHLGAVLEGQYDYQLIDGNVDANATRTALEALGREPHALVGVSVMPGPQVGPAIAISAAIRAATPGADCLGRLLPDPVSGSGHQCALRRLRRARAGRAHSCSSSLSACPMPARPQDRWPRRRRRAVLSGHRG